MGQAHYMLEDTIKVRLYKEFYVQHEELLRTSPLEYHAECFRYVMSRLEKILSENGKPVQEEGL